MLAAPLYLALALRAPCTDLGNAERFKARFGTIARWQQGAWFVLEGGQWQRDQGRARVLRAAHECVAAITAEAEAIRSSGRDYDVGGQLRSNELDAWATKSANAGRIEAMLNVAKVYLCK